MKKLIVALAVILFISAAPVHAQTTTLEFFGGLVYGDIEGLGEDFEGIFFGDYYGDEWTPILEDGSWDSTDPDILDEFNENGPFYGIGAVAYEFDWNLPDWNEPSNWTLGVNLWVQGEIEDCEFDEPTTVIDESFEFECCSSLYDITGMGEEAFFEMLSDIPLDDGEEGIGGYLIDGDWESGVVYFALDVPVEEILAALQIPLDIDFIDYGDLGFGGTITLTASECGVIPEPATMSLLGMGLIGLAGLRKRKNS